jgi:cyclopropane fatty-acyl-phospholipid synthase-like methyltransferase
LPGGVDYVLNLVKPFGFNPAMSVLDISIGLGGPAKHIAEKFNIYINGMEADHDIAELGRAAMVKAGLSRRILISDWDPESHELRPRSFDGIYGQHLTLNLYNKERLFAEIKKALKDNGHFTFTDFVLKEGVKHDDPALRPWMSLEPKPVMPWTVQAYIDCMTQVGLDCRIFESQAEGYIADATRGWADYFQSIDLPGMSEENLKTILREATLSNHRVELLKRGLLDVYRFYAIVH